MKVLSVLLMLVLSPVLGLKAPVSEVALRVRGGGRSLPIKPSQMVKIFAGFYALNGALSLPAPESAKDFALREGTLDYVIFENLGAISLSYASLVYMTAFSHRSAPNMVALSSLPLAYVTYKNTLKGLTTKLSNSKIQGPATTAYLALCIYFILTGRGNAKNIATLLAVPPLIIGIVSQFNLGLGMELSGFGKSVMGKKGKAIYVWFAALMAGWGMLALMRLRGGLPAMESIGRAALLETCFMIDCIWLRKWNIGVAPDASNFVFLGIPLLTAVVIFLS